MIKSIVFTFFITIISFSANAGNKFRYYFNHPVDNSVSRGVNAVYLNNCMADTLVAYINRSMYTLDIAVYDYIQGSFANIATAVNNAYSRGVQVRWIFDSSSSNTGLSLINSAINRLGSPTSGAYGIMHCKFMVVDGNSPNPNDAIVWTGSTNWTSNQFNSDYNNVVIVQDSALAHAYIAEFNMMWGGTGLVPNTSLSKFGPHKTDLGRHNFTIDGNHVELYFSPSDGTNSHIQSTISTADKDLYFAMYAFTDNGDASLIMSKNSSGVYVAGIDDNFSNSYSPYTTFSAGLGSNFKVYSGFGIYHNKFLIVDPSDLCSDPIVLTGSHNWSVSADTKNDENTLIIHNDTAANIYYQSFRANFTSLSGSLSLVAGCGLETPLQTKIIDDINVYPNPSSGEISIRYELSSQQFASVVVYNVMGRKIASLANCELQATGSHSYQFVADKGLYVVQFDFGNEHFSKKVLVVN
jgi:PLD-like domain/Secretion system C-terminal sorting domain